MTKRKNKPQFKTIIPKKQKPNNNAVVKTKDNKIIKDFKKQAATLVPELIGSEGIDENEIKRFFSQIKHQTRVRAKKFLEHLILSGNVSASCQAAGCSRRTMYELRRDYQMFADLWQEALEVACDMLELEVRRRAKDGVKEEHYDKEGNLNYTIMRYSDRLAERLLEAHRPKLFGQKIKHEVSGVAKVIYEITGIDRDPVKKAIDVTDRAGDPPKNVSD